MSRCFQMYHLRIALTYVEECTPPHPRSKFSSNSEALLYALSSEAWDSKVPQWVLFKAGLCSKSQKNLEPLPGILLVGPAGHTVSDTFRSFPGCFQPLCLRGIIQESRITSLLLLFSPFFPDRGWGPLFPWFWIEIFMHLSFCSCLF